jgi:apolipoprotein N-acyltransferase
MNRYFLILLSLAGGVLCSLAWSGWCTGLILLVGLVPFLLIAEWIFEYRNKFTRNAVFIYIFPGMVIFSMITMGWMRAASLTGAVCVILGLALLMTIVFWLAHIIRLRNGNLTGILALTAFWLTYEFISLNVSIVSPWMNLGNGLAKDILFVQWYEYTGTAGGSLWILASNLLLAITIVKFLALEKTAGMYFSIWLLIIIIPASLSTIRYFTIEPSGKKPSEVLIIQPNVDPFNEKFVIPFSEQLGRVINLAKKEATGNTSWILTPETTIDDPVNLDYINNDQYINAIRQLTGRLPGLTTVAGLVSIKVYSGVTEPPTVSARKTGNKGEYTDHYNSAFRIDSGKTTEYYHKSKLVPGIEMQFSNGPGRFLSRILPDLGGTKWGYGIQSERTCLHNSFSGMAVAPIICYESVFGSYVSGFVHNGAEALFIITNDGWWKNTNGYKQHLWFASLRAIETRRPIARAANTGVSCFIDIRGKRTSETEWWRMTTLKGEIIPEDRITAYVKYGDLIPAAGVAATLVLVMYSLLKAINKKKR